MASFKYPPSLSSSIPSSKPRIGWTYDVFLSFRGEDVRYTFVDHLYAALVRSGINVFKDDKMLGRGKIISQELIKAIEESRCAVVVFSKKYATSSWCLTELAKIMEGHNQMMGQLVLPVFYHVDPSDVRAQKNEFETAFLLHEEKFREEMDIVKEWREALTAAANLSGYHISETVKEGESAITNKIVEEILRNMQPRGMKKNLVGIESRIKELESLLDLEAIQEVRMVGIWGMGGIGKTTIAKVLFGRIFCNFEGSSFVKDVRENGSSKRGICALQQKIVQDMRQNNYDVIHNIKDIIDITDPEDGAEMIQTRFCNKKVLLVLDDVDNVKQLDFLAAAHEWFGAGSRIIITTRDKHLLANTNANYEPAILLEDQAVELFSRHAFRKSNPPEGYKELSHRLIRNTGCLPLALKVLGSFFNGREVDVWESALNRLEKTQDDELFATLNISFEGLEVSEKKIFLDIACFFKGKTEKYVTRVLDSCGFDPTIGISVLIEKSLITVSDYNIVGMHDLLQELGLQIVHKSYPWSRVWQHEKILDAIKETKKLEAIEVMVLNDVEMGFRGDVFANMKNLRLLVIYGGFTSCKPTTLPDELRWLEWYNYPFSSLPVTNMRKLVGLEISYGEIEHFSIGDKVMPYLKFIDLRTSVSLKRLPDVSCAPNVERLILSNCHNLVEVHESLGSLRKLVYLDMSGCYNLKCLPSKFEMESLETLDLSDCWSLENFPEISPCMVKLSEIHVYGCCKLQNNNPDSIRNLIRNSWP